MPEVHRHLSVETAVVIRCQNDLLHLNFLDVSMMV